MMKFKMKRKILLTGIAIFAMFTGIAGGEGKKADAATAPKWAGVEKVIYLDGKNKISVQGKNIVSISYSSSKRNIATVDSKGVVKPKSKGKTEISASVIYKKKASGKSYTKKLKYTLKVLGKTKEYFETYTTAYNSKSYGYAIKGLTNKGKELEKLYIPSYIGELKVKRLYRNALRESKNMVSLHLSDNLTYMYGSAAIDCPKLKRLYIGKNLSDLGYSNVFIRCSALEEIILDDRNEFFTLEDGILFSADKSKLLLYPRARLQSSYTIPNGVERIGSGAFAGCLHLKKVVIPETVDTLGQRCFSGSGLLAVTIPDEVRYLGNAVFQSCVSLSEVKLSKQFTNLPENTFKKCSSLKSIFLPASISWINARAFAECSQLAQFETAETNKSLYTEDGVLFSKLDKRLLCYPVGKKESNYRVPSDINAIGDHAFYQCKFLESVELPEGLEQIEGNAFNGSGIREIVLPDTIQNISYNVFQDCKALNKVKLPQTLTSLSYGMFCGCDSLEEIVLPKEVSNIASNAFDQCSNFKRYLVAPENTTFTESDGVLFSKSMNTLYSYPDGKEVKNYTIPATVTNIWEEAFCGADWLCGVSIPDSVKSIGYRAFADCENLETIRLPKDLEKIESGMFQNCKALNKITIPSSVKKIDDEVFQGCTALESITIPNSVDYLGYRMFSGCSGLKTVKLGKGIKTIASYTFEDCTELKKLEIKTEKLTEKSFRGNIFKNTGKDNGKKLVIKVPSDKQTLYKKLFLKNGLSKNVVIKKL